LKAILSVSLALLISALLHGQDVHATFAMARANAALGNIDAAVQQLERVIFFGDGKYDAEAFALLGELHLQNGAYTEAATAFNQAAQFSEITATINRLKLLQSAALIRSGKSDLASIELLGMHVEKNDSAFLKQQFLLGITQFTAGNFSESRTSFRNAAADTNAKIRIDSLFEELSRIKHPKAKTARMLSIILPGAGQFYAGDIKNGVNSLLLTGGFVLLGYFVATQYSLLDATVAVIPWIQRYYMGGFKRAGFIAEERKKEKQDKIYREIIAQFQADTTSN
jgi:tetratricopeptide (TPR) repeat protein